MKVEWGKEEESIKVLNEKGFKAEVALGTYDEFPVQEVEEYLELNSDQVDEAFRALDSGVSREEYEQALLRDILEKLKHKGSLSDEIYERISCEFWKVVGRKYRKELELQLFFCAL